MLKYYQVIIIFSISTLIRCQNDLSEEYIKIENQAINDIIPGLINLKSMTEMKNLDSDSLKLFLISSLDTQIINIRQPEGYTIAINGIDLPKEDIERNKRIYEKDFLDYKTEIKLFAPINNGTMSARTLNHTFTCQSLQIELVSEFKSPQLKKHEIGYLSLSRIYFNQNFDIGHLSFGVQCGIGCAWSYNIEIRKNDGKWKITKYFSGGIA